MLGRRYGARVIRLLCKMSFEATTCVAKTEGYFTRRGAETLLFAKFVPGLSTVSAPIAGQTGMRYSRFLLYDLSGTLLWSVSFLMAGRFFGDIAKRSQAFFAFLSHFAVAVFILMVVGFFLWRVIKQHRFLAQVRELRLEPSELMEMLDCANSTAPTSPSSSTSAIRLTTCPTPACCPAPCASAPPKSRASPTASPAIAT